MVVLRWPREAGEVERLAALGLPRLLMVEPGAPAPECDDALQDWVRLPAPESDVLARLRVLERRLAPPGGRPELDEAGKLTWLGACAWLSPAEQVLASALCERFGGFVHVAILRARVWPDGAPNPAALRVLVLRLRRRIAPLGLEVRAIHGRGYLLTPAGA